MNLIFWCGLAHAAWPLSGTTTADVVQDPYGPRLLYGDYDFHRGLDLDGHRGDPVHAVADGVVVRLETAAETAGTGRRSFGSWVLVQHDDLDDGTPVHTAYFHLDSIDVGVGDVLLEGDALGTVGDTGDGVHTVHLHLNAYHGLYKTYIKKRRSVSPYRIIDTGEAVSATVDVDGDTALLRVDEPWLDVARIELSGPLGDHVIDFETEEGICDDDPVCDRVTIAPADYRITTTVAEWSFTAPALGGIDAVDVYDSAGDVVASW